MAHPQNVDLYDRPVGRFEARWKHAFGDVLVRQVCHRYSFEVEKAILSHPPFDLADFLFRPDESRHDRTFSEPLFKDP